MDQRQSAQQGEPGGSPRRGNGHREFGGAGGVYQQHQQGAMQSMATPGVNMAFMQSGSYPQAMPQAMMMPQGMQYYPMMAPQGMQYYPVPAHQMHQMQMYNPNQQVGQMGQVGQVGQMGAQTNANMFFKTRLCNKWRQGLCPFGDKCTYAHGQHELRRVAPEVLMQQQMFAAQQGLQATQGQEKGRYGKRMGGAVGGMGGMGGAVGGEGGTGGAAGGEQKSQLYYKTRLCIRFMQSGYCVKGNECTFAHGYDDLRLMKKAGDKDGEQNDGGKPGVPGAEVSEVPEMFDRGKGERGERGELGERGEMGPGQGEDETPLTEEQLRARKATLATMAGRAGDVGDVGDVLVRKASPYADDADDIVGNGNDIDGAAAGGERDQDRGGDAEG